MDSGKKPGIKVDQIFLNKALIEHSAESLALPSSLPANDHELTVNVSAGVSEDSKSGLITVTVQTTPDNKGVYRFILEMVGFFSIEPGEENMPISEYIATAAPATMFPFVREAVANLTGRGRFGPVWLKPVNLTLAKPEEAQAQAE